MFLIISFVLIFASLKTYFSLSSRHYKIENLTIIRTYEHRTILLVPVRLPVTDISAYASNIIVRPCWATDTLKLYDTHSRIKVPCSHFCISLFSFEQRLIAFYLALKILILDKLRIFKMKTSLFRKQQRLSENYKIIAYYLPL